MSSAAVLRREPQSSLNVLRDQGDNPLAFWEEIDWDVVEKYEAPKAEDASSDERAYEAELANNPYSVKLWIIYLDLKKKETFENRFRVYERAVSHLPRSYKIWYQYLEERIAHLAGEPPMSPLLAIANNAFERCLVNLSQMPMIWLLYLEFLQQQSGVSKIRRCFDRAIQSLPITQHYRIWEAYIAFVDRVNLPELSVTVYRRYLMLEPQKVGAYVELLRRCGRVDEAAAQLAKTLNEGLIHVEGKSTHDLWMELCDLIAQNPREIHSVDVEKVLRSGLRRFASDVAMLWCGLANHFILLGQMDKARDVFEEALSTVATTHDFGVVFDTYAKLLESILSKLVRDPTADPIEVDLMIARLENLVQRRPLLLSSVKLRQNPNNVIEWFNRIKLFTDSPDKVIKTYTEALVTVDPFQALGRVTHLWVRFAMYYEQHDDMSNVRAVFERAIKSKFRSSEDLATIWCSWVEMELRHKNYRKALEIIRRSIHKPAFLDFAPRPSLSDASFSNILSKPEDDPQEKQRDLEECLGTFGTLKSCVEKMFDLKVITPAQALNYALVLEEKKYWEESFRVYERGVAIFRWPYVYDVWLTYLSKFVSRYGGTKLERARELFEQALVDAPTHLCKRLYLMFGKLEEEYGLARHALAVYQRAAEAVSDSEHVYDFYCLLLAKTAEFFGTTQTRSIFERAIERLSATEASTPLAVKLGIRFMETERGLGEIDRARAVLQHCSQFCDPRTSVDFWQKWRDFEVAHGNEDLFRDMLRVKRSVQAVYSQDSVFSAAV